MPILCGNRTVGSIGVILLLVTTGLACLAASWNPDDTAPFERDVAQAADHARRIKCETASCKAIIVIDEVVKSEMRKFRDINKDILYSDKAGRTAARTLNTALLDHPALFGSVCQMSARLLSRFHNGPDVPDIAVPIQLLVESVDMDIRDHGHCAHDLITALPTDEANIEIRLNAHVLCVNDDNNHRRTRGLRHADPGHDRSRARSVIDTAGHVRVGRSAKTAGYPLPPSFTHPSAVKV